MKQKKHKLELFTLQSVGLRAASRENDHAALFFPMTARGRSGDTALTANNVCMKITKLLCIHYNDSILMFN